MNKSYAIYIVNLNSSFPYYKKYNALGYVESIRFIIYKNENLCFKVYTPYKTYKMDLVCLPIGL